MDKTVASTNFGVFKPVGHTFMAFYQEADLQSAVKALKALGFADSSMVRYAAAEVAAQVAAELHAASPLATFGYELDLRRVHGELARQGCCFLLVHAPTDALSARVTSVVRAMQPAAAQHYGHLLIEDLTEKPMGRMGGQAAG